MIINKLSRVEDFITPNHFFLFSRALFIGTLNAPPLPSRGNEVGFALAKRFAKAKPTSWPLTRICFFEAKRFAKAKLGPYVLRVQKLQNASSEYPFVVRRKGDSTTIAFFTLVYAPAGAKKDTTGELTSAKQSKTNFVATSENLLLRNKTKQSKTFCESKTNFVATSENLLLRNKTKQSLLKTYVLCFALSKENKVKRYQKIINTFFYYPYKTSHTIVRPLITCSRRTITRTCRLSLLPVYPDVTNFKVRYSRNRIRKQIIPSIQFFFNPKVEKALFQFSEFYKKQTSRKKTGF